MDTPLHISTCSWKYDTWKGILYPEKKSFNYLWEYSGVAIPIRRQSLSVYSWLPFAPTKNSEPHHSSTSVALIAAWYLIWKRHCFIGCYCDKIQIWKKWAKHKRQFGILGKSWKKGRRTELTNRKGYFVFTIRSSNSPPRYQKNPPKLQLQTMVW